MTSCPVCGTVLSRSSLEKHITTHSKQFTCSHCPARFASRVSLVAHERNVHNKPLDPQEIRDNKLLPCDKCNKVFMAKYHLKTHMSSHSNEKLYSCDQCGKSYSSRSNMKAHMRIHDGSSKKFNCPYDENCGMRFSHRSEVKQHRVAHISKFFSLLLYVSININHIFSAHTVTILLHTSIDQLFLCYREQRV